MDTNPALLKLHMAWSMENDTDILHYVQKRDFYLEQFEEIRQTYSFPMASLGFSGGAEWKFC